MLDESLPRPKHLCHGTNKAGNPCGFAKALGTDYCVVHNPAITEEQRQEWRKRRNGGTNPRKPVALVEHHYKSRAELLEILSKRIDTFLERFGDAGGIPVEQTICDMMRTYCCVLKVEAEGEIVAKGWRMKGAV